MTPTTTAEPQHFVALREANRIRLARAAVKRAIFAGKVAAADVIRDTPPELSTMPISELLRAQRRWGRTRARKFLAPLMVSENRRLERLTERQRDMLAGNLENGRTRPREVLAQ